MIHYNVSFILDNGIYRFTAREQNGESSYYGTVHISQTLGKQHIQPILYIQHFNNAHYWHTYCAWAHSEGTVVCQCVCVCLLPGQMALNCFNSANTALVATKL